MFCRRNQLSIRKYQGATLIEVLVTVAVTSVGLLGMAGLLAVAAKANQDAYFHTQANFAAQALIESMHVNIPAVVQGRYDGGYPGITTPGASCLNQGCTPPQRADFDRFRFDRALTANLPNAKASMKCDSGGAVASATTYEGICRLQLDWSERALDSTAATGLRTLVWVFQP